MHHYRDIQQFSVNAVKSLFLLNDNKIFTLTSASNISEEFLAKEFPITFTP